MLWHLAFLLWIAGISPAVAGPPLGCLETSSGARWCDWSSWRVQEQRPVEVVLSGPHPAVIRRAPVPVSGHPAVVSAIPADQLLPWRGSPVYGPGPRVEYLSRSSGLKIGDLR